jgi:hypothetical protein
MINYLFFPSSSLRYKNAVLLRAKLFKLFLRGPFPSDGTTTLPIHTWATVITEYMNVLPNDASKPLDD